MSFLLWTAQHSIYRYIVMLDLLSGAVMVTFLHRLLRPGFAAGVAILAAVVIIALTRFGDWRHFDFGPRWFDVKVPVVKSNALFLITTDAPIGYVLPFLPNDARHVGAFNSINDPARSNKLANAVNGAIRDHDGPLYQLPFPAGAGATALAAHGLARVQFSCDQIRTNMGTTPIEICQLARVGRPALGAWVRPRQ